MSSNKMFQAIIDQQKMYTKEEKIELIREFQDNPTPENGAKIVQGYYKLIIKTAHSVKNTPAYKNNSMIAIEDLVNAGIIGMYKGLPKINIELGTNIDSYIMKWSREYMYRNVREMYSPVRMPVGKLNSSRKLDKLVYKNNGDLDCAVDEYFKDESFSAEKINKKKNKLKKQYTNKISVNSIHSYENDEDGSVIDLEDPKLNSLEHSCASETLSEINNISDNCLTDIEKEVISKHFGINDYINTMTYQQIADDMGVTRMRVCQMVKTALRKMKNTAIDRGYNY